MAKPASPIDCSSAAWVLLAALSVQPLAGQKPLRPFETADLNRLESFDDVTFSPDGSRLAVVRVRARNTNKFFGRSELQGNDRADIWVHDLRSGESANLMRGEQDGSGSWGPVWSPDGSRLALLSTRGGQVRLWVWDGDKVNRVSARAPSSLLWTSISWLSNDRLLFAAAPEGEQPGHFTRQVQSAERAMQLWPRAWAGGETTASILESPASPDPPAGDLLSVDLLEGKEISIAHGRFDDLQLSPRGTYLEALRVRGRVVPHKDEPMGFRPYEQYELLFFEVDALTASSRAAPIGATGGDVVAGSLTWSSDETQLAFTEWGPHGAAPSVRHFAVGQGFRETNGDLPRAASRLGALSFVDGDLVIRSVDGKHVRVDPEGKRAPYALADEAGRIVRVGGEWIGLFGDRLRRIAGESSEPLPYQAGPGQTIVWPRSGLADAAIVVRVGKEARIIRPLATEASSLAVPADDARLIEFHEPSATAAWRADRTNGSILWTSSADGGDPKTIATANEFLQEIEEGIAQRFDYPFDSASLTGWIYHPPGEGPWPTVVWVYPGLRYGQTPPFYVSANRSFLNANILVSAGFAVLFPSMPALVPSDGLVRLIDSVLPALDVAATAGWTDPKRVGVFGHSEGGFAALGLAAHTDRFRAVAAAAAPSDPVSGSGIFQGRWRCTDEPHLQLFRYQKYEEDLGGPLYRSRNTFTARSPLTVADRIEAPVLLIHGDLDYVPIELSEQLFSSLLRQEKRARFLRLIGEGHSPESPANIVEFWRQIVAWFDENLRRP